MDRFKVVDGQLTLGQTIVGPTTALFAAPRELTTLREVDGVVHTTTTKRIDLVFVADNDRVVGVELKRGQDLISSHASHKLSRQLSTIGQMCNVVVLGISDIGQLPVVELARDLVSYQMMGTVVVLLPTNDRWQVRTLASLRPVLGGSRSILASFAWTDIDLKPKHEKPGWLLHDIPFVGDKLVAKLLDKFGTTGAALAATDEQWRVVGASQRVIDSRREAME